VICLAVTYTVRAGEEAATEEHLRALAAASRKEPGCIAFLIHSVRDPQRTFFLYEQYADQAALDAHFATPHFQEHGINGIRRLAESRVGLTCDPLD
jgi:quinol monooxygenase YgiN